MSDDDKMRLGILLTIGALFVGFLGGALGYQRGQTEWSLEQRYFPCAEDARLGYGPLSTTHVYCLKEGE